MLKIIGLHVPRRTRWTSVANVANQRNTAIARAVGQIVGTNQAEPASQDQRAADDNHHVSVSAERGQAGWQQQDENPTLFKALRQSQPSRRSNSPLNLAGCGRRIPR